MYDCQLLIGVVKNSGVKSGLVGSCNVSGSGVSNCGVPRLRDGEHHELSVSNSLKLLY